MLPPETLLDPAFLACLRAAAGNSELVSNFDRLYGANLSQRGSGLDLAIDQASGRMDAEVRQFVEFVFDTIYTRLDPEVIADLRRQSAPSSPT